MTTEALIDVLRRAEKKLSSFYPRLDEGNQLANLLLDLRQAADALAKKQAKREWDDQYYFGGNRELAITRDGYRCTVCGISRVDHLQKYGKDIQVHHIDRKGSGSEDKNNELINLQTVCARCHKLIEPTREPKAVIQVTPKFTVEYPSALDAERTTGIKNGSILRACKEGVKAGGHFILIGQPIGHSTSNIFSNN